MVQASHQFGTSSCYKRLRDALLAYISPLTVDMVLTRTLTAVGITPATLECDQVERVIEAAMLSLRMFVPEDRLPDLMLQLADLIEESTASARAHTTP